MALNNRQLKFIDEYIKNPNATQAAINAGYSEKTARSQGQRLLTHVDIKAKLKERTKDIKSNNILTATERMEILSKIALDKEARENDKIKAIDVMNKMDATYVTQIDMTTKQDITVTENPFKELDVETLKKLADANDK